MELVHPAGRKRPVSNVGPQTGPADGMELVLLLYQRKFLSAFTREYIGRSFKIHSIKSMIHIANSIRRPRLGLPTWERVLYSRSDEPAKRTVSGKPSGLYGRFKTPYSGRLEALREPEALGRDEN